MIVLVMESDDHLRRILERALPEFDVRSCATEADACRLLESASDPVDLLLMSLEPEPESGERLIRLARALPRPVGVVVTVHEPARLERWRTRVEAVVPRPYTVSALRAALRRAAAEIR